jgi:hypothetical protein
MFVRFEHLWRESEHGPTEREREIVLAAVIREPRIRLVMSHRTTTFDLECKLQAAECFEMNVRPREVESKLPIDRERESMLTLRPRIARR